MRIRAGLLQKISVTGAKGPQVIEPARSTNEAIELVCEIDTIQGIKGTVVLRAGMSMKPVPDTAQIVRLTPKFFATKSREWKGQ